jgi:hypothetical protein
LKNKITWTEHKLDKQINEIKSGPNKMNMKILEHINPKNILPLLYILLFEIKLQTNQLSKNKNE